ncbi:hypothetical protein [Pseudomonas ogarae]|uniref:hypothetical protein n=1 Tax=Pseudomonas ogarae (strain DSM 112162 / CECT 30235 / F113) TaxID=1114970 RepID=UPI001141FFE7|nr:hypothetical protein [Pseudomonas ogarae]
MNTNLHHGEQMPLFSSVPKALLDWANSANAVSSVSSALREAQQKIEALNKDRVVSREKLNTPITLL